MKEYKLLEVKDLNVSFKIDAGKVLAVNGVSFSLEEGKVLGIVGESGSGKSVTAYSIMGILDKNGQVDSGKIIYKGTDLLRISEKERREIRGNRISIIFQDAMTSLNPVWTIGNQLREAVLIHAKDPIKEATYLLENEVTSDLQRIASMEKGLRHHPDSELLKHDLEEVKEKLVKDREALETKTKEATEELSKNEHEKLMEYKAQKPALNKEINDARINYLKNFFKLDKKPVVDDVKNTKELKDIENQLETEKKALEVAKEEYKEFVDSFNVDENDELYGSKKYAFDLELKARNKVIKNQEKLIKKIERKYNFYLKFYPYVMRTKPRRDRYELIKEAKRKKYEFYWENKSAYRETKYSANKKAIEMLKAVGINDPERRMKQYPFEHSGGMLQRCMIAMALIEKPDILIADEPTTALDVTIQAQILELLKKLQKEYGMAIVIITHDLGVIAQICDEVDVMYAGRIVERGTVEDVFYNPKHEYTKGLLNSMPKLDSKKGKLESIQGNPVDLFCLPKGCAFSSRCNKCMEICLDNYPEEVVCDDLTGHAASCWNMIKEMHEKGAIDVVNGTPEGKPLNYNGAVIKNEEVKKHGRK